MGKRFSKGALFAAVATFSYGLGDVKHRLSKREELLPYPTFANDIHLGRQSIYGFPRDFAGGILLWLLFLTIAFCAVK